MSTTEKSSKVAKKRQAAKGNEKPVAPPIRHQVAVDEARERVERQEVLVLRPGGFGEELGAAFVENVTGADHAESEHRAEDTIEERGGPFVVTSGVTEFATGTDASNPVDSEREAIPTVSAPQKRR